MGGAFKLQFHSLQRELGFHLNMHDRQGFSSKIWFYTTFDHILLQGIAIF